jgi:ectoine hydroxylase-related dioxygenase (phytanoyl-CoA dioxygenase family)
VYLEGANSNIGTTEVKFEHEVRSVQMEKGGLLLFNPNMLTHRALYSSYSKRPTIEITLIPHFSDEKQSSSYSFGNTHQYPIMSLNNHEAK